MNVSICAGLIQSVSRASAKTRLHARPPDKRSRSSVWIARIVAPSNSSSSLRCLWSSFKITASFSILTRAVLRNDRSSAEGFLRLSMTVLSLLFLTLFIGATTCKLLRKRRTQEFRRKMSAKEEDIVNFKRCDFFFSVHYFLNDLSRDWLSSPANCVDIRLIMQGYVGWENAALHIYRVSSTTSATREKKKRMW